MIYALDCNGIKAGFLKPFSQVDQENLDRTTSLFGHLFQSKTVQSISHEKLTQRIAAGEVDELLEEAVSLHRSIAADNNVIIVAYYQMGKTILPVNLMQALLKRLMLKWF